MDLATIQVIVSEAAAAPVARQPDGRLSQAAAQAGEALVTMLSGALVAAGYVGPFILIGLLVWFLRRRRLRLV